MSLNDRIGNEYFEWMYNLVCGKKFSKKTSFRYLLEMLHDIEFKYSIPKDQNRAEDGIDLRYRFARLQDCEDMLDYLDGPCSVFEMMVALSVRCEETIMDDPSVGDRTGQWFWGMIVNLGLGSMTDNRFDRDYVEDVISTFLDREYEPDGKGGLFTVEDCIYDLRTVEIWHQMCWYLDNFLGE